MAAKKSSDQRNKNAVALGHLGGVKGGPARAKALKPEKRTSIAKHAADVRWHGKSKGAKG